MKFSIVHTPSEENQLLDEQTKPSITSLLISLSSLQSQQFFFKKNPSYFQNYRILHSKTA